MEIDQILDNRQLTHGDFAENAEVSQRLKAVFRSRLPAGTNPTTFVHQEALDMIALKLSRILSGQADFADHWVDIAGYAVLAAKQCTRR